MTDKRKAAPRRAPRKAARAPESTRASEAHLQAAADPDLGPDVVWYRLYTFTELLSRPFFSNIAKPYHLSHNDWRVLNTLAHMPDTAAHELVRISGMTPMNVSRAVAALRKRGRLQETPDPANRVRKRLALTNEGLALYKELAPTVKKSSKHILAAMSKEEVAALGQIIEKLIARIEELNGPAVAGVARASPRSS